MVALTPQGFFAIIAAVVVLGFILDHFFTRTRISSILPLMLLGLFVVQSGLIPAAQVADLVSISGFVAAFAIAMILLGVGLQINLLRLYTVFGRATAWTFVCQAITGIALSLLFYVAFGWPALWAFVFGFAASGPASIVVQALVRMMVMREELRVTVLFEAVLTDVLELVVPTLLIQIYLSGAVSGPQITQVVLLAVLGSVALGVAAGLLWVWALDRGRSIAAGFTWALTVTMALGLYAASVYLGLSGALVIFIFGLIVGNAALFDARRGTDPRSAPNRVGRALARLRGSLQVHSESIDVRRISDIQQEANYIVGAFFFFYIGTIFIWPTPNEELVFLVPVLALGVIVVIRLGLLGILRPFLDTEPRLRRMERGLIVLNVPRGLGSAVAAALVLAIPGVLPQVPGFTDAMFMLILCTNILATIGIFLFYRPAGSRPPAPTGPVAEAAVSPGAAAAPPSVRPLTARAG